YDLVLFCAVFVFIVSYVSNFFLLVWGFFSSSFFFFDTAPTELYTLSLHDALPISVERDRHHLVQHARQFFDRIRLAQQFEAVGTDRKSTRLNSSHVKISYAVFCLKKKIEGASQSILKAERLVLNVMTRMSTFGHNT